MLGYDTRLFAFDPELGYVFPKTHLVSRLGFTPLATTIHTLTRRIGPFLILNLGDSSTSGWNSDKVYSGCHDPTAALFTYPTYSDFLALKYKVDVINAGVPGYTTYQAHKYLSRLLKLLAQNKIYVDYVTIYLGNNDCTYNGPEDKARLDYKAPSTAEVFTRVTENDFRSHYDQLLTTSQEYGSTPIVLVPASNFEWPPGLRSKRYPAELRQRRHMIQHHRINDLLATAERAYHAHDYDTALENDFLLPRIKTPYKSILYSVSALAIDTQPFARDPTDFIDYCHPGARINERIADAIYHVLTTSNTAYMRTLTDAPVPSDTYSLY